jgi:hypothetical protein
VTPCAVEPQKWGENFPWLAEFLETCWDKAPVPCVEGGMPQQAREIFLAWLQRFYSTALQGSLDKGQALFIAGKTGLGKTLLCKHVIAGALGGGADATDYLMGDKKFNKNLFKVACWEVHDAKAKEDRRAFAEMVKKTIANPMHDYEAKFHDSAPVLWDGRVIVTLNDDTDSLGMVPDTSSGLADKITLLKFSDEPRDFPAKWKLEQTISQEMPYFLRFLIDWPVPEAIKGAARYGIKAYMHETTRVNALLASGAGEVLEIIDLWTEDNAIDARKWTAMEVSVANGFKAIHVYKEEVDIEEWQGTVSEFLHQVAEDKEYLRPRLNKFSTIVWGRRFRAAARIPDSGVTELPSSQRSGIRYRITRKVKADKVRVDTKQKASREAA